MKQRGVFEKEPGSRIWWICYYDQFGKKHREKRGLNALPLRSMESGNSRLSNVRSFLKSFVSRSSASVRLQKMHWHIQGATSGLTARCAAFCSAEEMVRKFCG